MSFFISTKSVLTAKEYLIVHHVCIYYIHSRSAISSQQSTPRQTPLQTKTLNLGEFVGSVPTTPIRGSSPRSVSASSSLSSSSSGGKQKQRTHSRSKQLSAASSTG